MVDAEAIAAVAVPGELPPIRIAMPPQIAKPDRVHAVHETRGRVDRARFIDIGTAGVEVADRQRVAQSHASHTHRPESASTAPSSAGSACRRRSAATRRDRHRPAATVPRPARRPAHVPRNAAAPRSARRCAAAAAPASSRADSPDAFSATRKRSAESPPRYSDRISTSASWRAIAAMMPASRDPPPWRMFQASSRTLRQSVTYSQRNPSPQRLTWPRDGDGKCAKQHSVLVSQ